MIKRLHCIFNRLSSIFKSKWGGNAQKGSSLYINEGGVADTGSANNELYRKLKDSIECLKSLVAEGIADIRENLNKLRQEVKLELKAVNYTVKDLEPSLNLTHNGVDILKEQFKAGTKEQISQKSILEQSLKGKVEWNTNLDQHYQTGEFRINNIKESKDEFDSTQFIVFTKDLVLEADQSKQEVCQEGSRPGLVLKR